MAKDERFSIQHEHLVLCEGVDERNFLIYFFNSPELNALHSGFANNIDIYNFGGNNDLSQALDLIQLAPGYSQVKSLLIVRDAEQNAQGAIHSIQSALQNKGFSVPDKPCHWCEGTPKTAFILFPTCAGEVSNGALEDLCLSILRNEYPTGVLTRVDEFLNDIENDRGVPFRRKFKNKLYTYLSATDDFVTLKVGEAAKANAFDWNHPLLNEFKQLLLQALGE